MTLARLPLFPQTAYPPRHARVVELRRRTPDKRGWGDLATGPDRVKEQRAKTRRIVVVGPRGQTFDKLRFMADLAPLAEDLLNYTLELGYDLRKAGEPDGGLGTFYMRPVRGTTDEPSWHSWCVAIDINSKGNLRSETWRSTVPPWMVELWESAGWLWGGRFRNPFDTHHFEYLGSPADVAVDRANARATFLRIKAQLNPPPAGLHIGDEGDEVAELQELLNGAGAQPPLVVDAIFGQVTDAAVRTFQTSHALVVDGIVTALTMAALTAAQPPDVDPDAELAAERLAHAETRAQLTALGRTHDAFVADTLGLKRSLRSNLDVHDQRHPAGGGT